jgi:hypothetical protein
MAGIFRKELPMRYTADLRVTFVMEHGRPENLAQIVLDREVAQLQRAIEHGRGFGRTGVKKASAKVDILSQGPAS